MNGQVCGAEARQLHTAAGQDISHTLGCEVGYTDRIRPTPTITATVEVPAHHDFGVALRALKDGRRVVRHNWNGKGMWVQYIHPSKGAQVNRAYLAMKTVDNELVPWVASQTDMLAEDWAVLP